jgi:hypothetical protein
MRSIRHTLYSFRVRCPRVDAEGLFEPILRDFQPVDSDPCCLVNIRLVEAYSQEYSQTKLSGMRRKRNNVMESKHCV